MKFTIWLSGCFAWLFALMERSVDACQAIDVIWFFVVASFFGLWLFMYPAQTK